jgi:hypothetical protein
MKSQIDCHDVADLLLYQQPIVTDDIQRQMQEQKKKKKKRKSKNKVDMKV